MNRTFSACSIFCCSSLNLWSFFSRIPCCSISASKVALKLETFRLLSFSRIESSSCNFRRNWLLNAMKSESFNAIKRPLLSRVFRKSSEIFIRTPSSISNSPSISNQYPTPFIESFSCGKSAMPFIDNLAPSGHSVRDTSDSSRSSSIRSRHW